VFFLKLGVNMYSKICVLVASTLSVMAFAQPTSSLEKIKASGEIAIGVRESSGALSYSLGDGKYAGMHVDLCQQIVVALEKQLGKKLAIKYVPVTSQNRIPLVQNGTVDLECGGTTNNATRQKDVSFLNTTFVDEVRIAVKSNSGISSINQLKDQHVATTTGSTSVQYIRRHERANGMDFKELFGKDHADSFLLLESGRADAFVNDSQILAGNIAVSKNPADFKIVGEVLNVEPIAVMLRKDDKELLEAGNRIISELVKSGNMSKLWDKWFMQPIPPKNIRLNLIASESTKAAWANPNSKPMEDYAKK
jgi:glutamate/aspartate transport system substrate-binding protein